jgi:hypothetical protein
MAGGDLHIRKPKAKSPKRIEDEKRYTEICKEIEAELRAQDPRGRIFCFFSGDEIPGQVSFHHLRGRGRYLKDKQYLVPSINANHLDYHFLPWDKWSSKPYHQEFMARLQKKDPETYEKELRRGIKALPKLNPKLFQDQDDFLD